MPPRPWMRRTLAGIGLLGLVAAALAGCAGRHARAGTRRVWIAGATQPAFDPDGPPQALRVALERALGTGLVERDADGVPRLALADSCWVSPDSLAWHFRLRNHARFTDGTPLRAADVRAALLSGLGRTDHATRGWLLAAVQGVSLVRAGRPLPAIGVEAESDRELVIRLTRREPGLLERLACPGVSTPWKSRTGGWSDAIGSGPYRILSGDPGRSLTLVRADADGPRHALFDTVAVRFSVGAGRVRFALRRGEADLVWPLPPAFLATPVPATYALRTLPARPPRRLLVVLREDVPPLTKLPARHALAHAIDRARLLDALGQPRAAPRPWLPGAPPFAYPSYDLLEARRWLARGDLGGMFHVTMAFDADGAGAEIARALQGQWAQLGVYADLRAERGSAAGQTPLAAAAPPVLLVESQAPLEGLASELAALVLPLRGPSVGAVRTGWRTREFDRWITGSAPGATLDPAAAQRRLEDERVAIPIAELPWSWLDRVATPPASFDPWFGPEFAAPPNPRALPQTR